MINLASSVLSDENDCQPHYPTELVIEASIDHTKEELDQLTKAIKQRYPHVTKVTYWVNIHYQQRKKP